MLNKLKKEIEKDIERHSLAVPYVVNVIIYELSEYRDSSNKIFYKAYMGLSCPMGGGGHTQWYEENLYRICETAIRGVDLALVRIWTLAN